MMRWRTGVILLAAIVVLAACKEKAALSIHGLGSDDQAVAGPDLVGHWEVIPLPRKEDSAKENGAKTAAQAPAQNDAKTSSPNGTQTAKENGQQATKPRHKEIPVYLDVTPEKKKGHYHVAITQGRRVRELEARLFHIAGHRYLDCVEEDKYLKDEERLYYEAPHTIFKVEKVDGGFNLAYLTESWVDNQRTHGRLLVNHTSVNGTPVLTASPEELQAFLSKYADVGQAATDAWEPLGQKIVPAEKEQSQ